MKLLLIEDDPMLSSALCKALIHEGFVVHPALSGREGIEALSSFKPEIVILDLGLPDIDGTEVLKRLRVKHIDLPTIILTARHSIDDKVNALDVGADDYLEKPFDMAELFARLRVLARRLSTTKTNKICIKGVILDLAAQTVHLHLQPLTLTRREYMVLKALMENSGRVQTKDMIESKLYGWGEEIGSNTIEVHVSNLRKKLPAGFIRTIRGLGYTINQDLKSSPSH
ncbi:MAG: response regulator transcription factor [Arenicella sp.]|nr:response regulator transcription factor [Arenicella sp.]